MITWKDRIEQVKATFAIKSNKQLEEQLGLGNGYVNDLIGGSKNKNPKKIIEALGEKYKISPVWFFDESVGMFGDKQENAIKQESELILAIRKTENNNEDRFSEIESRLTALEALIKEAKPASEPVALNNDAVEEPASEPAAPSKGAPEVPAGKEGSQYTAENEPEYGEEPEEEYEQIPYVHDIAAGPPINQSEDQSEMIAVPARLIRTSGKYYAASIRGTSMTETGIRDGDMILIRHTEIPKDGAIQVVRHEDRSTLKRVRELEGNRWELHYEDGTGRVITCGTGDYEVQGEFVAVLAGNAIPWKNSR